MLPAIEVLRCDGEARMSQFANGSMVGVGREMLVADPITCTPLRKAARSISDACIYCLYPRLKLLANVPVGALRPTA